MALNFNPLAFFAKPPEVLQMETLSADLGGSKRFYPDTGPPPHTGVWAVKDTLIDYGAGLQRSYERATNFARRHCPPEAAICQGTAGMIGLVGGGVSEAGSAVIEGGRALSKARTTEEKIDAAAAVVGGVSSIALTVLAPVSGSESLPARGARVPRFRASKNPVRGEPFDRLRTGLVEPHQYSSLPEGRTLTQLPGRSLQPVRLHSTMEGAPVLKPIPRMHTAITPAEAVVIPALEGFPAQPPVVRNNEGFIPVQLNPHEWNTMLCSDEGAGTAGIEPLATLVHEVSSISGQMISAEEVGMRQQEILQTFAGVRSNLSHKQWETLMETAQTPLEKLFVIFVRDSDALSPAHWALFLNNATPKPPNPVGINQFGECTIDGKSWIIRQPGSGLIPRTPLFFEFDGDNFVIAAADTRITVNGAALRGEPHAVNPDDDIRFNGNTVRFGVRQVHYEIPQTVWPDYRSQSVHDDSHPYAIEHFRLNPGDSQKYLVLRTKNGEYGLRVGAKHHYLMLGPDEIFVAGGWFLVKEDRTVLLDGQTSRFGHIMRDKDYLSRVLVAARLFTRNGYRTSIFTVPHGDVSHHRR